MLRFLSQSPALATQWGVGGCFLWAPVLWETPETRVSLQLLSMVGRGEIRVCNEERKTEIFFFKMHKASGLAVAPGRARGGAGGPGSSTLALPGESECATARTPYRTRQTATRGVTTAVRYAVQGSRLRTHTHTFAAGRLLLACCRVMPHTRHRRGIAGKRRRKSHSKVLCCSQPLGDQRHISRRDASIAQRLELDRIARLLQVERVVQSKPELPGERRHGTFNVADFSQGEG